MSDNGKPASLAERFWRMSLYLFGGVILIILALELLKTIWWIFALAAAVTACWFGIRWFLKNRTSWEE